jgi:hypothetical protein
MTKGKPMTEFEKYTRPYSFHGMTVTQTGTQAVGECPVCEKERFYIALEKRKREGGKITEPGMWYCQGCGQSGNVYTFLKILHEVSFTATKDQNYKSLALNRKLPERIFKRHQLAMSVINGDWLYPCWNHEGKMNQLYRWRMPLKSTDKSLVMATPELGHGLLNLRTLSDNPEKPIMVVEGHWDLLAMDHVMLTIGVRKTWDLLAVPGSNVFKDGWEKYFKGRDVVLLYDADEEKIVHGRSVCGGRDGMDKVQKHLANTDCVPDRLRRIAWPVGVPDGYDVRDLVTKGIPSL